jgi:hypothetical protein
MVHFFWVSCKSVKGTQNTKMSHTTNPNQQATRIIGRSENVYRGTLSLLKRKEGRYYGYKHRMPCVGLGV